MKKLTEIKKELKKRKDTFTSTLKQELSQIYEHKKKEINKTFKQKEDTLKEAYKKHEQQLIHAKQELNRNILELKKIMNEVVERMRVKEKELGDFNLRVDEIHGLMEKEVKNTFKELKGCRRRRSKEMKDVRKKNEVRIDRFSSEKGYESLENIIGMYM